MKVTSVPQEKEVAKKKTDPESSQGWCGIGSDGSSMRTNHSAASSGAQEREDGKGMRF